MHEAEEQWPSVDWTRHYAGCVDVPRCRHQPHLPAWWRSLMYRGDPCHPDTEAALADAIYRVGRYKGHPRLPSDAADFTRRAVLDALPAAPQPVQTPWVNYSLTIVGGLARWAVATGQPITREHLLTERVIARYVHQFHADKPGGTRAGYISRLELIAGLLTGHRPESVPITQDPPGLPLTREQEADAWQWARSLSTSLRRHQMKTIIAFARGAGLHRSELGHARPEHVTRDEHGVHVHIATRGTGRIRTVTVDAEWEDRVAALAATVPPGRMLLRPSSDRPYASALTGSMQSALKAEKPPAYLTMRRLRNTWLARQMESGAPLTVLMDAAGLSRMCSLEELLPVTALPSAEDTARWLRRRNA